MKIGHCYRITDKDENADQYVDEIVKLETISNLTVYELKTLIAFSNFQISAKRK